MPQPLVAIGSTDGFRILPTANWELYFGWNSQDLADAAFEAFVHPDDRLTAASALRNMLVTGSAQLNSVQLLHKSGHTTQFSLSATLHPDAGTFAFALIEKIPGEETQSELAMIETSSSEREHFLNQTLSALPVLVSYFTPDLVYRYVNAAYERWFGLPLSAWPGRKLLEFIGDASFEFAKPRLEQALQGESQSFEMTIPYKTGGTRILQVLLTPDLRADGSIPGLYAVLQDVTPQMRAAAQVKEKEEALRALINGIPAMIGYWDLNLVNVYANEQYAKYFSMSPDDLRGRQMRDLISKEVFERNIFEIESALQGEALTVERNHAMPDGTRKDVLASFLPDSKDGVVSGFYMYVIDISVTKRLERERREIEAKLIAASKMSALGEMAGALAHEINNPICIISGVAYQLRMQVEGKTFDSDAALGHLGKIESTVNRIAAIVHGLLSFAREAEADPIERVSISEIVDSTMALCREKMRRAGVNVILPEAFDVFISGRSVQISQILMNLLNNALDAIVDLDEKWIEIEVAKQGPVVHLSVIDSGTGIAPSVASKIMHPFFTTKPVGHGTGLGLSVSKGLAEKNGGTLTYNSQHPRTRFDLELPVAP